MKASGNGAIASDPFEAALGPLHTVWLSAGALRIAIGARANPLAVAGAAVR